MSEGEGRGRVLVVDDDPMARRGLQKLLALEGFSTEVAEDGPSALRLVAEGEFDVVVTDLKMPNMGGAELIQRLRVDAPDIPVIVVTVFGTGLTKARDAGAAAFLLKPVDLDELTASIESVMQRGRG
ncbi:MAG TPA: response regulator [Candidatus Nanopelagicales bacterium]|nr:response regulator [Candidatus Nanopelagicales bacterium]